MPEVNVPSQESAGVPPVSVPEFKELSDADREKQCALNQAAAEALEDGNKELALEKFTEAIELGTDSAMLYAKRAQVLMQLNQLDDCVKDCDVALALNPDSSKSYKIRARAYVKQEKFVEANLDFAQGQKIDYDDDIADEHKEIMEKAKAIQAEQVKQRISEEKAEKARIMAENKKKYEEGVAARDKEMREQRMADEKRKEEEKEAVKQRNRDKWAKEEAEQKSKREAEEEAEEINAEEPDNVD